jgi:hypothetical protein
VNGGDHCTDLLEDLGQGRPGWDKPQSVTLFGATNAAECDIANNSPAGAGGNLFFDDSTGAWALAHEPAQACDLGDRASSAGNTSATGNPPAAGNTSPGGAPNSEGAQAVAVNTPAGGNTSPGGTHNFGGIQNEPPPTPAAAETPSQPSAAATPPTPASPNQNSFAAEAMIRLALELLVVAVALLAAAAGLAAVRPRRDAHDSDGQPADNGGNTASTNAGYENATNTGISSPGDSA